MDFISVKVSLFKKSERWKTEQGFCRLLPAMRLITGLMCWYTVTHNNLCLRQVVVNAASYLAVGKQVTPLLNKCRVQAYSPTDTHVVLNIIRSVSSTFQEVDKGAHQAHRTKCYDVLHVLFTNKENSAHQLLTKKPTL